MPLIFLPSEKAGRGRGPGTGEGGFLPRSLASPSPESNQYQQLDKFGVVGKTKTGLSGEKPVCGFGFVG